MKLKWGERRDGKLLRDIDSMHFIMPLMYPNRCDNEAFISERIDLTNVMKYLEKKNADGPAYKYNFFQVMVTAVLKTIMLRPQLNRFIANGNLYERYAVTAAFTVKKIFSDEGEEALAVFCRGEKGERERITGQKENLETMGARIALVENPVTAISSTDLRRMLIFGCADPFLMPGVGEYIRDHGLYGTAKDRKNLSMEELEAEVVSLLNPNRVAHVLGCRDCAVELAKLYGENETDAARAGLLHDITKAIDGPLQLTLCAEYGMILDTFSRSFPKTLHALTGSLVAERIFGENENVVSAICHHTTGRANMTLLEKIIYIADYVERNRDFPGVEEMRALAYTDLDAAVLMGLQSAVAHVKRQGQELAPATIEALEFLMNR